MRGKRGFTLVELMVVVAIVAILAALAVVGTRRYRENAQLAQAAAGAQAIRSAQEAWKAETGNYMSASSDDEEANWYPAKPTAEPVLWDPVDPVNGAHPDVQRWAVLNPAISGAVPYQALTVAGPAGATPEGFKDTTLPAPLEQPKQWYKVEVRIESTTFGDYRFVTGTSW